METKSASTSQTNMAKPNGVAAIGSVGSAATTAQQRKLASAIAETFRRLARPGTVLGFKWQTPETYSTAATTVAASRPFFTEHMPSSVSLLLGTGQSPDQEHHHVVYRTFSDGSGRPWGAAADEGPDPDVRNGLRISPYWVVREPESTGKKAAAAFRLLVDPVVIRKPDSWSKQLAVCSESEVDAAGCLDLELTTNCDVEQDYTAFRRFVCSLLGLQAGGSTLLVSFQLYATLDLRRELQQLQNSGVQLLGCYYKDATHGASKRWLPVLGMMDQEQIASMYSETQVGSSIIGVQCAEGEDVAFVMSVSCPAQTLNLP